MLSLVSYQTLNPLKIHPKRILKTWFMILIMKALNFLFLEKILARLKRKIILVLMCYAMKLNLYILFKYQMKNLKIAWTY